MLDVSNEYKNTIISPKREFLIKVIINDQEIESKYLKGIKIEEISCSKEMISIGDVCSNAFELEMFILDKLVSYELAKVVIKSGLKYDDNIEWVDLGTYIVNEVTRDKYSIKLSGFDAMKRFEEVYEPNIIFNDETKFIDVLNDLLRQCKVLLAPIDLNEYKNIIVDHYFEGITCKELIGYLAGLMGCNVRINRVNELEFYWYQDTGIVISDELIYQDSYQESLENELVINSLTSGDETNTYVCGSGNGISFANPYMTQELLNKIFLKIEGFSYQPCSLKWRGNPCIENSDIIKYNDKNIVIMKQTLILDGGFSSQVECIGKLDNDVVMKTSSPTEIKLNKLYNTLTNALKHSTETILGQHGGNLVIDLNSDGKPSGWTIMNTPTLESYTKLWKMNQGGLGYSEDGGKTFKNIAFDMNGNFNANIINTGVINGEMFELDLQSGVIKIGKRNADGLINNPSFYLNEKGELSISAFEEVKEELKVKKYLLNIENSGTILNDPTDTITLAAKVYNGNDDETENISSMNFNWYRISDDSESDVIFNKSHKAIRTININQSDLNTSANFYCEITLPIGVRKTQSISIVDNNDIANLGNSYLNVTGAKQVQTLNTDGSYSPNWVSANVTVTPVILNRSLNVDLNDCIISYKKIINSLETSLTSGETVTNGILKINKNIMTKTDPAVTYVCYVSYKNTRIKLLTSFSLNVLGKDGAVGSDGISIISVTPYFAVNSSNTTAPASGWVTTQPIRSKGQYLWRKDTTRFSNNSTSTTIPYVITGDKGDIGSQGIPGKDAAIQSATPPSDKTQLWYDTVNNVLKRWNGSEWEIANSPYTGDIAPSSPYVGMQWGDTSISPPILKIWDGEDWLSLGNYSGSLDSLEGKYSALNTAVNQTKEDVITIVENTTVNLDGEDITLKKYVEQMKIDIDGITNTIKTTGGNNIIRDSIGCFNDGSWVGDYNIDSTFETRKRNLYGYAILLKNGSLKQQISVPNGKYTLSFMYKKIINLARAKVVVNGEEIAMANDDYTELKHTFTVTTNSIEIEFVTDTDNSCPVINLMLNKGDEKVDWSLNPNETWSDTVQIGRGVRIFSSGTDVMFVAYADVIGFVNKQGEYITTFDDEGMVANSIVVKNKATMVNLLIQDINGQTVINRINLDEVEVYDDGK